jgi:hypothetical protein
MTKGRLVTGRGDTVDDERGRFLAGKSLTRTQAGAVLLRMPTRRGNQQTGEREMRQMEPNRSRRLSLLSVLGLIPLVVSASVAFGASTPSVSFNSSTYDFGVVAANSNASHTFVLTNSGGKVTGTIKVDLSDVNQDASHVSTFSKIADTCTGAKLAPKKSCSVIVQYSPTASGSHEGAQLFARDIKPSTTFDAFVDIAAGVSEGCGSLNEGPLRGSYVSAGLSATFKAGETMTMSAGEPSIGNPTGLSLSVNSVDVDTEAYPGTVHYTIPADGTYGVGWTILPVLIGVGATWTVSCAA